MTRRVALTVVFVVAGLAAWAATSRVTAWGDELATVASTPFAYVAPPAPGTAGGIDFVECLGCDQLPGPEGVGFGLLALLLAGGPLAFVAAICERRQQQFGDGAIPSGWCQTGFVVQAASVAVGALLVAALVTFAATADAGLHWSSAAGFVNIFFGLPALFTWRRLHAAAFAAPARPLIRAA